MSDYLARLKLFGIFIFLFLISYLILSALWSSIYLSVSQSDQVSFYLQNVFKYLITLPDHLMGVIFDLPFDLVKDPIYLLLALIAAISSFIFKSKVPKLLLPTLFILTSLAAIAVFFTTHPGCIAKYDGCQTVRISAPTWVGLTGLVVMSAWPFIMVAKQKKYLWPLFKLYLIAIATFSLVWLLAVFLPIRENVLATERFHQQNAKQQLESIKSKITFRSPKYLPPSIGPKLSESPGTGITTIFGCGQTKKTGLVIIQEESNTPILNWPQPFMLSSGNEVSFIVENLYGNIYQTSLRVVTEQSLITLKFDPDCQLKNIRPELVKIARSML